jgi:putative membrane protein
MVCGLRLFDRAMTPHRNLTKTLLILGISAGMSTLPAQNTPTTSSQPAQTSGTDRQSTRSGSDTTDRNTRSGASETTSGNDTAATSRSGQPASTSGAGAQGTTANRNRTAETEMMVGQTDLKFMNETAQSGLMEVQAATLAQQKAQNDEVKKFAQQLLDDHNKANKELQDLAAKKNVNLPTEMGPKHQAHITRLQNMSDAQFDREWLKMQVDHHKKDVKEFQRHAERSMDSHVKGFAEKNLPTLQQHLQTAQNLQQTASRSRSANTSRNSESNSGSTSGNTSGTSGAGSTSDTNKQNTNDATQKPQGQNNPATQR